MGYPNQLAGDGDKGSFTPFNLFAGEKEIVTDHDTVATNQDLAQFQVVAKNDNGQLCAIAALPGDWEAGDPIPRNTIAVGVMAQAIKTTSSTADAPYYVSAFFNHEALVWPETVTTLAARKALLQGTEIRVGTLYGGN